MTEGEFASWARKAAMLLVSALSMLSLLACQRLSPQPTRAQTPTGAPATRVARAPLPNWLGKVPCTAPCWANITPGITSIDEALELLRGDPLFLDDVQVGSPTLSWIGDNFSGVAFYDPTDPARTITSLSLRLAEPFTLGDVIKAYGEPTYIRVYASAGEHPDDNYFYYGIAYYYLDYGLSFTISDTVTSLREDGKTDMIEFYPPSLDGFAGGYRMEGTEFKNMLLPWEGFKPFRYYCVKAFPEDYEWHCPSAK